MVRINWDFPDLPDLYLDEDILFTRSPFLFLATMYLALSALFALTNITNSPARLTPLRLRQYREVSGWLLPLVSYFPVVYLIAFMGVAGIGFNSVTQSNPLVTSLWEVGGEFDDVLSCLLVALVVLTAELCFYLTRAQRGTSSSNNTLFSIVSFLAGLLVLSFTTTNLLVFFLCFEATLLPIVALIHKFGSREKRSLAANYIFIYTVAGSIFLFPALFDLGVISFDLGKLYYVEELVAGGRWLVLLLVLGFAIKIPTYPLHNWLTHAHVEAPTIGSVILAALLLKLGTYGIVRVVIPTFPTLFFSVQTFGQTLAAISTLFASAMALRQLDLKRIVAYSSIAHMNFGLLALFTANIDALVANVILMFGHGLIAAGLFMVVGFIYDRYKSKLVLDLGGLRESAPIMGTMLLVLSVANFGFPGTVNFVAELLTLKAMFWSTLWFPVAQVAIVFSVAFTLWMYIRVYSGASKQYSTTGALDLDELDIFALGLLCLTIIKFGLSFTVLPINVA